MSGPAAMDMSLDDVIAASVAKKKAKFAASKRGRGGAAGKRGGGGGRGGRGGMMAGMTTSLTTRAAFPGRNAKKHMELTTGTKLLINNLNFSVVDNDMKALFEETGPLKRAQVNYDHSGRSKGSAEVVFVNREDAIKAYRRYNNVFLDGKAMLIEVVGGGLSGIVAQSVPSAGAPFAGVPSTRGAPRGRAGRGRGGRGRGRGGRTHRKPMSQEDLDADMDSYMANAGSNGAAVVAATE